MSPFIVPSLKKIVGANLQKIDKVDFRDIRTYRHKYIHTYNSDLIGPSLTGVQYPHTTLRCHTNNPETNEASSDEYGRTIPLVPGKGTYSEMAAQTFLSKGNTGYDEEQERRIENIRNEERKERRKR